MITKEEAKERMEEEAILFENPDYSSAIIGVSSDGRICYLVSAMLEYLIKEEIAEDETDAMDYLSYNTIRALDYISSPLKPIVVEDC